MSDTVLALIMRHTTLMDKIKEQSIELYRLSFSDQFDSLQDVLENRERMVADLNRMQLKIAETESSELAPILECWRQDIGYFIQIIERIDQEVTKVLEFQKEKTSKEISSLRHTKEAVKKYNLTSLR